MTNLDSLLKNRDTTLPTNVCLVKAMVFIVVLYGCESWTTKKGECRRIDAFELWCWRRLLRVPWTARRSNQFILKEISPKYSLEGLMLKLKLQYIGHLMWRTDSFEKTLMLGKIESSRRRDDRGWDGWMASPTQWTWVWVGDGPGGLACCSPWGCKELDMTEWLNWTEYNRRILETEEIILVDVLSLQIRKLIQEEVMWLIWDLLVNGNLGLIFPFFAFYFFCQSLLSLRQYKLVK